MRRRNTHRRRKGRSIERPPIVVNVGCITLVAVVAADKEVEICCLQLKLSTSRILGAQQSNLVKGHQPMSRLKD